MKESKSPAKTAAIKSLNIQKHISSKISPLKDKQKKLK
jgi:hypothetical protein